MTDAILSNVATSSLVLEEVPRQRLARVVADLLIRRIQEQHLAPGTKLPSERDLMHQLRVGRSTIREALNGLALLNVVEIRHGQGVFVSTPELPQPEALDAALSRGVTAELLEVRLLVEVAMAGFAAERATPEELAATEVALVGYERVLSSGEDSVHQGARFHLRLMEAGHNDILFGLIRRYTTHLLEAEERGAALERRSRRHDEGFVTHRDLFEAVRTRDPELARERMRAHLEQSTAEAV
jgi:DNA-binding FadR family transcriptional regulator